MITYKEMLVDSLKYITKISIMIALAMLLPWLATEAMAKEKTHISEIEFKQASIQDAIRVISELTNRNIIATSEAGQQVFTLFLRDISVNDAIDSISRVAGLWYRYNEDTGVYMVMTTEEYFKDIVVFRQEKTKVYTLRYQNVVKIARTIEAMFGDRAELDLQSDFDDDLEVPGATLNTSQSSNSTSSNSRSNRNSNRQFNARNNDQGRNNTNSASNRNINEKENIELTTNQIELLENVQRKVGDPDLRVSEKTLAELRHGTQVPVFVSVNREHNLLYVRTADDLALKEIARIVRESDRPTPQVLLEMRVMSIELDDGAKSAFDLSLANNDRFQGPPDGQPPNPLSPNAQLGPGAIAGLVNSTISDSSSFVFQLMNNNVRARIQLLESEGRVNVLSTPLLLASNNRPAKIFIGEETVITTGFTAQVSTTNNEGGIGNTFVSTPVPETELREIGNTLTILPSINSDRTVLMRLLQEASTVKPDGASIPVVAGGITQTVTIDTVDKSTMEGTVMAKDGLSVVVGGMITERISETEKKVPVLGDVPGLGTLFTDRGQEKTKRELVLVITPHVFLTPEEAEEISKERVEELRFTESELRIKKGEPNNTNRIKGVPDEEEPFFGISEKPKDDFDATEDDWSI